MNNLSSIAFLLLLPLFPLSAQVKKKIYVDETYKTVKYKDFKKKLQSELFYKITAENDTAVFEKLRFKAYFGHLDDKKKRQLNKLFHYRYKIDTSKIISIHYVDTLPDVATLPKVSGIILMDKENREKLRVFVPEGVEPGYYGTNFYMPKVPYYIDTLTGEKRSWISMRDSKNRQITKLVNNNELYNYLHRERFYKHKHIINFSDYQRTIVNEKKKYDEINRKRESDQNKKEIELIHFYNFDKGYDKHELKQNWLKDENNLLRNIFSDGMLMYRNILIYPNGDFYLSPVFHFKKHLFEPKSFARAKKKWERNYNRSCR